MAQPITQEQLERLLTLVDVIRDPLHGDIRVTSLERFLIGTIEFQRLRNINQLAFTYVAYPGAVHNRFIHALGTLHVCSEMMDTCNKNSVMYGNLAEPTQPIPTKIPDYCILVARLSALLHDLAHVPFGHTLEKEGLVFKEDEWQDIWRYEQIFGESSVFSSSVAEFLLEQYQIPKASTKQLLDEVASVLVAKRDDVSKLPFPFIHDLVGNTICADLIDYIQRDMYFCGLTESFGKRFLQYLAVLPTVVDQNDCRYALRRSPVPTSDEIREVKLEDSQRIDYRLVLLQYRYNEEHAFVQKHDVIAEGVDLVRKRLAVAEKLYFHRTKVVASSMIVAAAYDAGMQARDIWNMSDAEVLRDLEDHGPPRAKSLAEKLRRRHLLKPLFRASFHAEDGSAASEALWNKKTGAYSRFSDPERRAELIEKIEHIIADGLGKKFEDVIGIAAISCPNRKMNLKAFDMLVLPEPDSPIIRLQDSVHPPTRKEIEAIQETHEHLWKLEVFVDPKIVDLGGVSPFATKLAEAVEIEIAVKNEIPKFRNAFTHDLNSLRIDGIVSTALIELGVPRGDLKVDELDALTAAAQREGTNFSDFAKQFLFDKGYLGESRKDTADKSEP